MLTQPEKQTYRQRAGPTTGRVETSDSPTGEVKSRLEPSRAVVDEHLETVRGFSFDLQSDTRDQLGLLAARQSLTTVALDTGVGDLTVRDWAATELLDFQIEDRGCVFDPDITLAMPPSVGSSACGSVSPC